MQNGTFQAMCLEITLNNQAMCILPEIFRQYTDCLSESITLKIAWNVQAFYRLPGFTH